MNYYLFVILCLLTIHFNHTLETLHKTVTLFQKPTLMINLQVKQLIGLK